MVGFCVLCSLCACLSTVWPSHTLPAVLTLVCVDSKHSCRSQRPHSGQTRGSEGPCWRGDGAYKGHGGRKWKVEFEAKVLLWSDTEEEDKDIFYEREETLFWSSMFPLCWDQQKWWQKGAMEVKSNILRKILISDLKRGWKWERMGRHWNTVCILEVRIKRLLLRVPTQSDLHTCVLINVQARTTHISALSIIVYWMYLNRSIECNKLYTTICFLTDDISIAYRHTAIRGPWPLHTWLIDVWPCLHVSAPAVRDMLLW